MEDNTILCDFNTILSDKERLLLRKLNVFLIDDLEKIKKNNFDNYNMLIILECKYFSNYDRLVMKELEKKHVPLLCINKVPRDEVFELIYNIINIQVDIDELNRVSNEKIIEALLFIEKNQENPDLSLECVSNHLFLNKAYFSRLFRKVMGLGFKEYLIQLRISKAKQILESGHSVTDACMSSGYTNLAHFSQSFKKSVGLNPSKYRENSFATIQEVNNERNIL